MVEWPVEKGNLSNISQKGTLLRLNRIVMTNYSNFTKILLFCIIAKSRKKKRNALHFETHTPISTSIELDISDANELSSAQLDLAQTRGLSARLSSGQFLVQLGF